MGTGIVLMFWAVIGAILAGIGMLVLGGATAMFTHGVTKGRRTVVLAAGLFPFACLAWASALFLFQAIVNEAVLNRDPGLGDTWHCPLPNGDALMMIDVTDAGWVYNPKTQAGDVVGEQEDAVAGVRIMQTAGRYILGGSDSQWFQHLGKDSGQIDSYFLLDTQTGKRTTFSSQESLRIAASQLGIQLKMEPISSVYSEYRFAWFEVLIGFLACAPPTLGAWLLISRIMHLRRTRQISMQPI